jgi:hypothetical protein
MEAELVDRARQAVTSMMGGVWVNSSAGAGGLTLFHSPKRVDKRVWPSNFDLP